MTSLYFDTRQNQPITIGVIASNYGINPVQDPEAAKLAGLMPVRLAPSDFVPTGIVKTIDGKFVQTFDPAITRHDYPLIQGLVRATTDQELFLALGYSPERLAEIAAAKPSPWDAKQVKNAGDVVEHKGSYWKSTEGAAVGEEPGTSEAWYPLQFESLGLPATSA